MSLVAANIHQAWLTDRVVLRADPDLVGALLDTPRETPISSDWASRFRYRSVAMTLVQPLVLDDGTGRVCTYDGFVACGTSTRARSPLDPVPLGTDVHGLGPGTPLWTTYHPIAEGEGVRFVWLFRDDDGSVGGQSISVPLVPTDVVQHAPATVEELITTITDSYRDGGTSGGAEAALLVPVSVLLLLYLAATEPDLETLPTDRLVRPQQLTGAEIVNVGWRVGAAIRAYRSETADPTAAPDPADASERTDGDASPVRGGWRLPPHIRSAHFHRFRVATRDEQDRIVGDREGVEGVDWHYELRWIPPTPVNVGRDGPQPVVRDVRT